MSEVRLVGAVRVGLQLDGQRLNEIRPLRAVAGQRRTIRDSGDRVLRAIRSRPKRFLAVPVRSQLQQANALESLKLGAKSLVKTTRWGTSNDDTTRLSLKLERELNRWSVVFKNIAAAV